MARSGTREGLVIGFAPAYSVFRQADLEWFDKRPKGRAEENLGNSGTVPWQNARGLEASTDEWLKLGGFEIESDFMREGNTILAEPTGLGPSLEGFQDQFHACSG
jgi:hypothetical protein